MKHKAKAYLVIITAASDVLAGEISQGLLYDGYSVQAARARVAYPPDHVNDERNVSVIELIIKRKMRRPPGFPKGLKGVMSAVQEACRCSGAYYHSVVVTRASAQVRWGFGAGVAEAKAERGKTRSNPGPN